MNPTQIRSFFPPIVVLMPSRHPHPWQRIWISVSARRAPECLAAGRCLAVGAGYGRGELYPFSDVDLLVSLPAPSQPRQRRCSGGNIRSSGTDCGASLPLWDAGLELGHGIRTMAESMELAAQDVEVACSLLDARLLWGGG